MTLNLPLLYVWWLEEYCLISSNKNKSPNLWHVTSILVCYIFDHSTKEQIVYKIIVQGLFCIIKILPFKVWRYFYFQSVLPIWHLPRKIVGNQFKSNVVQKKCLAGVENKMDVCCLIFVGQWKEVNTNQGMLATLRPWT